jgi:hypothetical protein
LRRSRETRLTEVENAPEEKQSRSGGKGYEDPRTQVLVGNGQAALPKIPGDTPPTAHEIPQMPKKLGQVPKMQVDVRFFVDCKPLTLSYLSGIGAELGLGEG